MVDPATPIDGRTGPPELGIRPKGIPPTDRVGYQDLVARGKQRPLAWFDVREFGTSGDGNHDDAPAIQRAVAAAGKAGGGRVYLPAGTYNLESQVSIDDEDVWIVGAGRRTIVSRAGTTGHAFVFGGSADRGAVIDMNITRSTGATAGAAVRVEAGQNSMLIRDVYASYFFKGIELVNCTNAFVRGGSHYHAEAAAGSVGIEINGAGEHWISDWKGSRGVTSNSKGIYIHSTAAKVEGIRISNFSIIGGGLNGIDIQGNSSNKVMFVHIANGDIGEQSSYGISIDNSNTLQVQYVTIIGVAVISSNAAGIYIGEAMNDITVGNCVVVTSQSAGILVRGNQVVVTGCDCRENIDGIRLENTSDSVALVGNRCGYNQSDGIQVNSGTNNYLIVGNVLQNNAGSALNDSGSTPKVVANNLLT